MGLLAELHMIDARRVPNGGTQTRCTALVPTPARPHPAAHPLLAGSQQVLHNNTGKTCISGTAQIIDGQRGTVVQTVDFRADRHRVQS